VKHLEKKEEVKGSEYIDKPIKNQYSKDRNCNIQKTNNDAEKPKMEI
jgi:hypothetical protein